jgi:hypothetical protein
MTRRLLQVALADELRAEIARQHRTIVALAAQTRIAERTLSRRLSGVGEFRSTEIDALADALDIDVGTLHERAHAALDAAMRRHPAGSRVS